MRTTGYLSVGAENSVDAERDRGGEKSARRSERIREADLLAESWIPI